MEQLQQEVEIGLLQRNQSWRGGDRLGTRGRDGGQGQRGPSWDVTHMGGYPHSQLYVVLG